MERIGRRFLESTATFIDEDVLDGLIVASTDGDDLRGAILAEHVEVHRDPRLGVVVSFDFLCGNCGKRHWATEYDENPVLSTVGFKLQCGWVSVRMPWARTPARDEKSIYGVEQNSDATIDCGTISEGEKV